MKKILSLCLVMLVLAACQTKEAKPHKAEITDNKEVQEKTSISHDFPYPQLLPTTNEKYSLLAIGEQDEQAPIETDKIIIKNVKEILSLQTVDQAKKIYPLLKVEKAPAFVLFDKKGLVKSTTSIQELTSFLKDNPAKQK